MDERASRALKLVIWTRVLEFKALLASGTEQLDRITYGSGVSAVHWCAYFGRDVFAVQCFLNMCLWKCCVRSSLIEDFGSGVSTVHCLGDFLEAMCSQFN